MNLLKTIAINPTVVNLRKYTHDTEGILYVTIVNYQVMFVIGGNGPIDFSSDSKYLWVSGCVTDIDSDNFVNLKSLM